MEKQVDSQIRMVKLESNELHIQLGRHTKSIDETLRCSCLLATACVEHGVV